MKKTKKINKKTTTKKKPAKKAVKKKTPIKKKKVATSTKKTASAKKSPRKKKIKEAPDEACFWVHNGPIIKSLPELKKALKEMTDEQFAFHTERDGNDFARWIKDVLEHSTCAKRVEKAGNKKKTIEVLAIFIR